MGVSSWRFHIHLRVETECVQGGLAQAPVSLCTFYNFPFPLIISIPPPLLLLFLPLFASPPCASPAASPAPHRPSFSNQMKPQDYLPPSLPPRLHFISSPAKAGGRKGRHVEAEETPSPGLLPSMLSNNPSSFPLPCARLSVNSVGRIEGPSF